MADAPVVLEWFAGLYVICSFSLAAFVVIDVLSLVLPNGIR